MTAPVAGSKDRSRPFRRDLDGASVDPVAEDGDGAFADCDGRVSHGLNLLYSAAASRAGRSRRF
jgi:hypothetical protein